MTANRYGGKVFATRWHSTGLVEHKTFATTASAQAWAILRSTAMGTSVVAAYVGDVPFTDHIPAQVNR